MRVVSHLEGGTQRFGLLEDDEVREVRDVVNVAGLAAEIGSLESRLGPPRAVGSLTLASPVAPVTRNIFCVGWNYPAHFAEGKSIRGAGAAQDIRATRLLHQGHRHPDRAE